MKQIGILILVVLLSVVINSAWATEQEAVDQQEKSPLFEMSIHPKKTPEEIEKERWSYLFSNETGMFLFDNNSPKRSVDDKKVIEILVRTVYNNQAVIDQLNKKYGNMLAADDSAVNSDLQLLVNIKQKTYAIIASRLFSKQGLLLYENTSDPKFLPIKSQTLPDIVYQVAKRYDRSH